MEDNVSIVCDCKRVSVEAQLKQTLFTPGQTKSIFSQSDEESFYTWNDGVNLFISEMGTSTPATPSKFPSFS